MIILQLYKYAISFCNGQESGSLVVLGSVKHRSPPPETKMIQLEKNPENEWSWGPCLKILTFKAYLGEEYVIGFPHCLVIPNLINAIMRNGVVGLSVSNKLCSKATGTIFILKMQ